MIQGQCHVRLRTTSCITSANIQTRTALDNVFEISSVSVSYSSTVALFSTTPENEVSLKMDSAVISIADSNCACSGHSFFITSVAGSSNSVTSRIELRLITLAAHMILWPLAASTAPTSLGFRLVLGLEANRSSVEVFDRDKRLRVESSLVWG